MLIITTTIKPMKGGIWEVHFTRITYGIQDVGVSGTGNSFRVFATVMQLIKELINDREPSFFAIIAKSDDHNRAKVYETLVKRFAPKLGYKYVKTVVGKDKTRIDVKKN